MIDKKNWRQISREHRLQDRMVKILECATTVRQLGTSARIAVRRRRTNRIRKNAGLDGVAVAEGKQAAKDNIGSDFADFMGAGFLFASPAQAKVSNKIMAGHAEVRDMPSTAFVVDSGCVRTLVKSRDLMSTCAEFRNGEAPIIMTANGQPVPADGIGTVNMKVKIAGGGTRIIRLADVLLVKALPYNLLSTEHLIRSDKDKKGVPLR